jgi:hypothetical protein
MAWPEFEPSVIPISSETSSFVPISSVKRNNDLFFEIIHVVTTFKFNDGYS